MVVSSSGDVVASSQAFYPTYFKVPGYAEQDPVEVLNGIRTMLVQLKDKHTVRVEAIGISSAMHSLMAIDAKGNPLTPLILWSDLRSADIARQLKTTPLGNQIYHETGTAIHPMSPLCKLAWLRDHQPDVFMSAYKFISIKEFVLFHFCDTLLVDYSVASSAGLFDVNKLKWSKAALDFASIDESRLSECVSPHHSSTRLTAAVAKEFGLPSDIKIVMGASDGCLAHLGSHAMGKGQLSLTIGTSGAVRVASDTYLHDKAERLFNYRLDEHKFIAGGATNNGTVLLSWFTSNFCDNAKIDLKTFVQEAMKQPAGCEGLIFLPYVFGERAPYYNPDLRGAFVGLGQHHNRQHMMRALLEGICFEIRSIVASIEPAIGQINHIFASGGFVRSELWLQLMANVLGKTITLSDVNDASSLGAAMMAFESLGVSADFEKPGDDRSFSPEPAAASLYNDLSSVFLEVTGSLTPAFSKLVGDQK